MASSSRPITPRFVALCGAPGSGKTEVARILTQRYGAELLDDGLPLRRAVVGLYEDLGVLPGDPYTQEGKSKIITLSSSVFSGRVCDVRDLLGTLGNLLEGEYGEQILPYLALAAAKRSPAWNYAPFFVAPSCRKTQGMTWRGEGGLVVELCRPGHNSIYDFDQYDRGYVNFTISNTGSIEDLEKLVAIHFDQHFTPLPSAQEIAA